MRIDLPQDQTLILGTGVGEGRTLFADDKYLHEFAGHDNAGSRFLEAAKGRRQERWVNVTFLALPAYTKLVVSVFDELRDS